MPDVKKDMEVWRQGVMGLGASLFDIKTYENFTKYDFREFFRRM